jgi:uncharacterized protein (DUF58 family)
MPIFLIPIILFLLFLLEKKIFSRYWNRGLSVELSFDGEEVTEGEEVTLSEVITNSNFIPLHLLQVNFQTDVGLDFIDTSNASVTDRVNVIDVFSLRFFERIKRKLTIDCAKRGFYSILETSLVATDLFSSDIHYDSRTQQTSLYVYPRELPYEIIEIPYRQLMGEVLSKKLLYEDNFTFRGIRDYAPTDQMSSINWKASARTGELKVNLHDFTAGPEVMILLNVEEPGILYETELIEDSIRLAFTLAKRFVEDKTSVSLLTNGRDKETRQVIKLESGASNEHLRNLARALSRIDVTKGDMADIETLIEDDLDSGHGENLTYVLISTSRRDGVTSGAERIVRQKGELTWLCPLTKSMDQTPPKAMGVRFEPFMHE